jgi:hypothetical protein
MAAHPPLPDGTTPDGTVPKGTIVPNGTVLPRGATVARYARPHPAPHASPGTAYPAAYPANRTPYESPYASPYPANHAPRVRSPYPPQPYAPHPPYPPYPPQPPHPAYARRSGDLDGLALAGFLFSLFAVVPVAAVLSLVSLRRIRRTGEQGRGLAIAGLAVSAAWLAVFVAAVAVGVATSADRDANGRITDAGSVGAGSLRTGDCLADVPAELEVRAPLDAVPCGSPHRVQVVATFTLPDGEYPGRAAAAEEAASGCVRRLTAGVARRVEEGSLDTAYLFPLADSWRLGDHDVACMVTSVGGPMVGEADTATSGMTV